MTGPLLEVRGLRTWFFRDDGLARAVDGVAFRVEEGETVGLVGESGCGKTVTALSILGLQPSPPGRVMEGSSVRFRGEELVGASGHRMREIRGKEISMIFQEPTSSLNPVRRVGSQLAEALLVHDVASGAAAKERVEALLMEVGFTDVQRVSRAYPHELSGGMCQRIMIAMALACGPALLVADEPTTALDATVQSQILDLLAELRARRGMSMLLITHDLGVVAETCDRVVVMYAGRVVESGPVKALLEHPLHPYTRGLLASLPSEGPGGVRLSPIPGAVPSPTAWPAGCRFRDRCPHATEQCRTEPETIPAGDRREVACWLAEPRPAGYGAST